MIYVSPKFKRDFLIFLSLCFFIYIYYLFINYTYYYSNTCNDNKNKIIIVKKYLFFFRKKIILEEGFFNFKYLLNDTIWIVSNSYDYSKDYKPKLQHSDHITVCFASPLKIWLGSKVLLDKMFVKRVDMPFIQSNYLSIVINKKLVISTEYNTVHRNYIQFIYDMQFIWDILNLP